MILKKEELIADVVHNRAGYVSNKKNPTRFEWLNTTRRSLHPCSVPWLIGVIGDPC